MGQADILNLLKKNPSKKFDSKEIRELLTISVNNANPMLRQLRKYDLVNFDQVVYNRNNKKFRYWHKED